VQGASGGQVNDARNHADLAAVGKYFAQLVDVVAGSGKPLDPARVLTGASAAIPRAAHAGLTLLGARGKPETFSAADELPAQIDALQHSVNEGPLWRVLAGEDTVRVDDVLTDPRCAAFGQQCAEEFGVRSILSVPVLMAGGQRAVMSVYATIPAAFGERDVGAAAVFAPFAGLAVQSALHARKVEQLEAALHSSRQIGTAMGILMARHLLTSDEAFARMSRASQQLNRKLREIAEWVERTGTLPTTGANEVVADGHGPVLD
jgi:GAF domain-containing protein